MEIWKENRQTQSYSIVSHANACSCNGIFLSMCPVGNVRWHVFFLGFHKFKQEVFNTIENYCDRHPTLLYTDTHRHRYLHGHSLNKTIIGLKFKLRFLQIFQILFICNGQHCNIVTTAVIPFNM